jgi:acetyl esterase
MSMDRDVAAALQYLPPLQFADPAAQRRTFAELAATLPPPPVDERVTREKASVERADGSSITLRIFRPRNAEGTLPVLMWFHGGAYCVGSAAQDNQLCSDLAVRIHACVVSVDYRLAPEYPYPAALDDCYAATCWVASGGLSNVDGSRLAVGGASAGAGLAAAAAVLSRDRAGPPLAYQLLNQPFIDDRMQTASMRAGETAPVFNTQDAAHSWQHYLGSDRSEVPPYAAPARATDLTGLPPAFVVAAGLDCLRDEAVDYAMAMARAGVPVELYLVPGVPHGFDGIAPESPVALRTIELYSAAVRRTLYAQKASHPPLTIA